MMIPAYRFAKKLGFETEYDLPYLVSNVMGSVYVMFCDMHGKKKVAMMVVVH